MSDECSWLDAWLKAKKPDPPLPSGVLHLVATPIGNRDDITLRALRVLSQADIIAAEDTRRTGLLLQAFGIKKPLISCHAHNEEKQGRHILDLLKEGKSVALVSDAGMPGISDPGARVIRLLVREGIGLTVLPGPSAALSALAASGLDGEAYAFGGFFPREGKVRRLWLTRFGRFHGAIVFHESPNRILATLQLLKESWGDRYCCVAREMTKRYEEFIRGSFSDVIGKLAGQDKIKGEIAVVVEGSPDQGEAADSPEEARALGEALLAGGMGVKEASRLLAKRTGKPAKAYYAMLVESQGSEAQ